MLVSEFKTVVSELENVARIAKKEDNLLVSFNKEATSGQKALIIEKIKNVLTLDITTSPLKVAERTLTIYLDSVKLELITIETVTKLLESIVTIDKPLNAPSVESTEDKKDVTPVESTEDKEEAKKLKSLEAIKAFELVENGKIDEIKVSSVGLSVGDDFLHPKYGTCTITKCYAPAISKGMFNGKDYIDYTFLLGGKKKVGNTSASMLPKHKAAFDLLTVEQKEDLRVKSQGAINIGPEAPEAIPEDGPISTYIADETEVE